MSEEYKNMDYYQLYEYIEGLRIELEEAQASTEFQAKRADELQNELELVKEICGMYGNQIPLPCPGDLGDLAKYIINKLAEIEKVKDE